ncbi:MAG: class C sortase [Coriobacteriaceae bacterium]|nr:class C sortase [Coriobacteriaceae bacterium]
MAGRDAHNATSKNGRRRRLSPPVLLIALGIIMCMAPIATDLFFRIASRNEVNSMSSTAEAVDSAEKQQLLAQARAYNARLGGYEDPEAAGVTEILPYNSQLSVDGSEIMGWIEIPRADVVMKVYHGIGEPALSAGVGHQPETSLPVGGARSHCYLTGHSGLQQHRIFDGIRALEEGDVFAIHILGDAYAYRVTSWEIVDPTEVDVTPQDGDMCTLVTCTTTPDKWNPKGRIGINDKRLLVHGVRCEYDPEEFEQTKPDVSAYVNDNTRPALIGTGLLVAFAAILALGKYVHTKRRAPLGHHGAQR